jgi:23S rRNA pseudouridine2605 synthase
MKRKTDNFSKFYNKKNNAAIKESFRQEKKAAKKERREAIERRFEERRQAQGHHASPNTPPQKGPDRASAPSDRPGIPAKGPTTHSGEQLPLNKYIAHGGICSRRDAADLIRQGKVTVNGKPVTEPGTKVVPTDLVKVNGKKVTISRNFVYVLLNKPKDYLTTMDDPQGRRTVLDLIRAATTERVFPVGRLDRNTSGVLLLTNDGDLAQKLAHPSHEIKKVYHVTLDKALTKADFDKIVAGVTLEDGPAFVDVLAYADPKDRAQVGLEIHSGRNRIVRRIFEHLGYDVRGLDRVMYAGLTKKNVQRGKWRLLTEKEIRILKYLNSSIKGSSARAKDWAAPIAAPKEVPAVANEIPAGHPTKSSPAGPDASRPAKPFGPAKPTARKPALSSGKPTPTSGKPTPTSGKPNQTGRPAKPFGSARPTSSRKPTPTGRPERPNAAARRDKPKAAAPRRPAPRPRKPKNRDDEE